YIIIWNQKMRNGNTIAHHSNHAPEFSLSVSPRNENCKNQVQYDYKTFQIVNGNQLEIKSIPHQSPQKYNNMMPGKKLKAVRVNSDKVPSVQNTMHDWRQIISKNQQNQLKQQQNTTSCVVQTSNYNIVSLAQAIQSSAQHVETKSQEVFKFTTNNFNKKKRSNTNVITDVITNDRQQQNQNSPTGMTINNINQEQNRLNYRKQSEHSSVCVIYKYENERDLTQSFIQKDQKTYSTQKSEIIPIKQNTITENNSRQNSPSLSTLIIQNQQRQFNIMKNTYDFKNLESQDQNKIKITSIVNQKQENKQNDSSQVFVQNGNQKNDQANQALTNLKDQQSQLKINNYQLLTSVKIPQTFIQNPFYVQQIQNQLQQQESQNEESHIFLSKNKNSLYECIFNRQSPQKIGGFKKQDEAVSRLQTAEFAQQEDTLDFTNINPSDNNKNNQEQEESLIGKKRSSSTQKSPENNQSYQTNYQFQNLISIQNQKFLPIQKQSGSQFLYQRMMLRSAQNSIQQKDIHQQQENHQKIESNTLAVNGFHKTGAIDNYKILVDFNKERQNQEANVYLTQKKVFKKPIEASSDSKNSQIKTTEQNCENNKVQGVYQIQNRIKLDPIQRQERAKSAQDTQFKAFNEETYIVNLDDQKQQILHIRKLRRKNGESNPITQQQQYLNKEDYYNTPIQSEQVKKKNSISQIDTDMSKAINYKQMNVFLTGQQNQNNQYAEKEEGGDKKEMNQTQIKYKNKQQIHRVKDIDYSSKIQKTDNQQIDQNDTTTQASTSIKKGQNNNSNKLIKLQQYYDLKYESKYGKFWDNNKRKVSSDSYQNKIKQNHKLNMSMQQDSSYNYQTTQYQLSNIQSQYCQAAQSKQDQQMADDSNKSVLKILHEKQKREQENTNIFTNPDPWDQESLSDSSFTIENTKK
ncbi:endo-1,4-beta-xylanase xylA, putative, partial (macronuclear) [Tetrahymena thermophila SB210]